jgi:hypothetical protein
MTISRSDSDVMLSYRNAGQGSWVTMPEGHREVYREIHQTLTDIASSTVDDRFKFTLTSGFHPNSGIRNNRPKDLWCALSVKDSDVTMGMPQIYLIISGRGAELGFAASIHPGDFSNQEIKQRLRETVPSLFSALPEPTSEEAAILEQALTNAGQWRFRKKNRLSPEEPDEFPNLDEFLTRLRSATGMSYGSGVIARYWRPAELDNIDLQREFQAATDIFSDLVISIHERATGTITPVQQNPPSYWIEKTIVAGRPDRENGPHSLGEALWSPQASTDGRDIYKTMRHVQSGDVILHLIDNLRISGVSIATDIAAQDFAGLSDTDWADRPAYRIQLEDYEGLSLAIERTEFFDAPEPRAKLRQIQQEHSGLFYTAGLELNQGAYLTAAPEDLVKVFDDIYREKTGSGLPHVSLERVQQKTHFNRHRLKGAETLFKWIYGENGFASDRYIDEERKYKDELSREWRAKVNENTLNEALANDQCEDLAKEISDLLGAGRSNLLPWRYHDAIKKNAAGPLARELLQNVHDLLISAKSGQPDIDAFNESMMPAYEAHIPAAIKPASHCIPSLMLWLSRPDYCFYLRPDLYTRTVKGLTGSAPDGVGNIMSTDYYSHALAFANDLHEALGDLQPEDMIDVQGLAWGVFSNQKVWFGGKTYTDPDTKRTTDMLQAFLEKNVYAMRYAARPDVIELLSDASNMRNKEEREQRREALIEACPDKYERDAILNFFDLINSPNSILIAKSTFAYRKTKQSALRALGICRTTRDVSYDEEMYHQVSVDWLNTFEHEIAIGSHFPKVVGMLNSLPMEDALDMLFPDSEEGLEPAEESQLSMQWLSEMTLWDEPDLQQIVDTLNDDSRQIVFAGPPGTGKTWLAKHLARFLTNDETDRVRTVQFHPSYGYEEFIEGIHPSAEDGAISFKPKKGVVLEFVDSMTDEELPHILLIDEMNRANLPRVFGELMYLFEYRDEQVALQYSPNFRLPPNLWFIGTMNTADRSIRSIDTALRRRFDIFECAPDRKILERFYEQNDNDVPDLLDGFDKLNARLTELLDRHHTIGHTFFMARHMNADRLGRIWKRKIFPLIEDYFFDQPTLIEEFKLSTFWAFEE